MKYLQGRLAASRHLLRGFRRDEAGNIAVALGLCAIVLMLAIGAAVDFGRWLHARDQTAAALDAAVLAGGRTLHVERDNKNAESLAIAAAQKFYAQNVASRLPVSGDDVKFSINSDGKGVSATGNAYIDTPFLHFAGIERLPLLSESQTKLDGGASSVFGTRGDVEVSVMLDVTGSMAGQRLKDLKDSAKDLVSVVLTAGSQSKIAIVPFSEDIRLPTTSARDKARGTGLPSSYQKTTQTCIGSWCYGSTTKTYKLTDCVVERTGTAKYTDAAPTSTSNYVTAKYGDNTTSCTIPSNAAIQPLTNDKTSLISKIDGLGASGGTAGHLGTAWAWYTLSPNWNSLWSSSNQARAYDSNKESKTYVRKVAVLMTDGEYNTQYEVVTSSSKKVGIVADQNATTSCPSATNGCSSVQAVELCKGMKAAGVEVYAIVFGTDTGAVSTMKQCALNADDTDPSKPKRFYAAKDGDELKSAYRDIGIKLTALYLSK